MDTYRGTWRDRHRGAIDRQRRNRNGRAKLPDHVDTMRLYQCALAAGVAINPGPEWSTDKAYARSQLRLCFASPSPAQIREGIALLAEVCRKEFGVPTRISNLEVRA